MDKEAAEIYNNGKGARYAKKGVYSDTQGWSAQEGSLLSTFRVNTSLPAQSSLYLRYNVTNQSLPASDWISLADATNTISLNQLGSVYYEFKFDGNGTNLPKILSYSLDTTASESYLNEQDARNELHAVVNSELSNPAEYDDVIVYVVYENGTHGIGTYDKFFMKDNKRWAFNYITGSDFFQLLNPLGNMLNFWENANMTANQLESSVSSFVVSTG